MKILIGNVAFCLIKVRPLRVLVPTASIAEANTWLGSRPTSFIYSYYIEWISDHTLFSFDKKNRDVFLLFKLRYGVTRPLIKRVNNHLMQIFRRK